MTTDTMPKQAEAWWKAAFPAQYYAFPSSTTLGAYPVAGLVDLNVYSSQPSWLTSGMQLIALTQAQWLTIATGNLIIKNGAVVTYVAPTTTTTTDTTTTATSSSASTS